MMILPSVIRSLRLSATLIGLAIFAAMSFAPPALAQVGYPSDIGYQGRLLDSSGNTVSDGTYDFRFNFYNVASAGSSLSGNLDVADVSVSSGYFSLSIPHGANIEDFRDNIYLEVAVKADADSSYETLGRVEILKTPYSIFTQAIENATSDPANAFKGRVYYNTTSDEMRVYNGTSWTALGSGGSPTLDDAYDNFGANAQLVTVDDATTGLEFEVTAAGNYTIDLQSTGDFVIQDAGTAWAQFTDGQVFDLDGTATFSGNVTVEDETNLSFGSSNDASLFYDTTTNTANQGVRLQLPAADGSNSPVFAVGDGASSLDLIGVPNLTDTWFMVMDATNGAMGLLTESGGGRILSTQNNIVLQGDGGTDYLGMSHDGTDVTVSTQITNSDLNLNANGTGTINLGSALNANNGINTASGSLLLDAATFITANNDLYLADDNNAYFGTSGEFSLVRDSVNTQFELNSTDIDGIGTDGNIFTVSEGTTNVDFAGSLHIQDDEVYNAGSNNDAYFGWNTNFADNNKAVIKLPTADGTNMPSLAIGDGAHQLDLGQNVNGTKLWLVDSTNPLAGFFAGSTGAELYSNVGTFGLVDGNLSTIHQTTSSSTHFIGTLSAGAGMKTQFAEVNTADATVTTIDTIAIPTDQVVTIHAKVDGVETTTASEAAGYEITATFKNDAGTVTQIGTTTQMHAQESSGGLDATFNISTTNVQVQVTGLAVTSMNWQAVSEVTGVSGDAI